MRVIGRRDLVLNYYPSLGVRLLCKNISVKGPNLFLYRFEDQRDAYLFCQEIEILFLR